MSSATHRSRLSTAFLLLVVLTGWIAAPLIHEIEHALERAGLTHVHDVRDEVTLRTGCDPLPSLADECPVSLTKVHAIHSVNAPVVIPRLPEVQWNSAARLPEQGITRSWPVRGPPSMA